MGIGVDDTERPFETCLVSLRALIAKSKTFLIVIPVALLFLSLAPSAEASKSGIRQRPIGLCLGDAPAGAQDGMGPGQLVGGGADVHAGVVEHEVIKVDKFAVKPQTGAGVGEVRPAATMISAGLADPRMKIEIEVTARKQSGQP